MGQETNLSWEYLRNAKEALDSYKVRALMDAREEILEEGIYSEQQYYEILFKMIDEEMLKYALHQRIFESSNPNFSTLRQFAEKQEIPVSKAHALLEQLEAEKLVEVNEVHEEVRGSDDDNPQKNLKELEIIVSAQLPEDLKPIYEPVKVIFNSHTCSGCGLCVGICPVN